MVHTKVRPLQPMDNPGNHRADRFFNRVEDNQLTLRWEVQQERPHLATFDPMALVGIAFHSPGPSKLDFVPPRDAPGNYSGTCKELVGLLDRVGSVRRAVWMIWFWHRYAVSRISASWGSGSELSQAVSYGIVSPGLASTQPSSR